jgi:hypothetical protein
MRAADCVHERGQFAVGAGGLAAERVGDPACVRRESHPHSPAITFLVQTSEEPMAIPPEIRREALALNPDAFFHAV